MSFMTFYEYMLEAVESDEKTVAKLEKTRASIHNHWKRGGEARHARGRELIYRYNDLKTKLKDTEQGTEHWNAYCKKYNFSPEHEGHDHYS